MECIDTIEIQKELDGESSYGELDLIAIAIAIAIADEKRLETWIQVSIERQRHEANVGTCRHGSLEGDAM